MQRTISPSGTPISRRSTGWLQKPVAVNGPSCGRLMAIRNCMKSINFSMKSIIYTMKSINFSMKSIILTIKSIIYTMKSHLCVVVVEHRRETQHIRVLDPALV